MQKHGSIRSNLIEPNVRKASEPQRKKDQKVKYIEATTFSFQKTMVLGYFTVDFNFPASTPSSNMATNGNSVEQFEAVENL